MGEKSVFDMDELRVEFKEVMHSTGRDIKIMEINLAQNQNLLNKQLEKVESLEAILGKSGQELVTMTKLALHMKESKVETSRFEETIDRLSEELTTVKYATQDTFRTLLQTDNYLQKYHPFAI